MDWTHRLRLRNLQILLSLGQTGNISRSAAALHMTQPGLSKWLKELEEDVDLPLFERHARGLRSTPYGEALIAHAARIDAHLSTARDEMASMAKGGSGLVRIGTSGAGAADTVPLAVLKLVQTMPLARVQLVESTMDRLLEQLDIGELDIIVGRSAADTQDASIRTESLYLEPFHFVCRPKHPILTHKKPAWEDLLAFPWITWPKGTPIRTSFEAGLAAAGLATPAGSLESNSVTMNLTLLNNSNMIGVASHRAALRFARMNVMAIVPTRQFGFGSVAMYWREDAVGRSAVDAAVFALREVVNEFTPQGASPATSNAH